MHYKDKLDSIKDLFGLTMQAWTAVFEGRREKISVIDELSYFVNRRNTRSL